MRVFALVEHLESKLVVLEPFAEFLPGYFVADLFKNSGDLTFVICVFAAFQVLALSFDDEYRCQMTVAIRFVCPKTSSSNIRR